MLIVASLVNIVTKYYWRSVVIVTPLTTSNYYPHHESLHSSNYHSCQQDHLQPCAQCSSCGAGTLLALLVIKCEEQRQEYLVIAVYN